MTFMKKNFGEKPSLVKPIAILVAILLIIGGVYSFFGNKNSNDTLSSGLDKNQAVTNVGDVEEVVAKWIDSNPEAIILSLQRMQQKASEQKLQDAQKNISSNEDKLTKDKSSPEFAPQGYNITIVEFFDYACGYCKKANEIVEELLKDDKKVRIVFKEYPILGAPSIEMSTVALAVQILEPKSYFKFHNALMNSKERGKEGALKIAQSVGIDVKKLESTIVRNQDKIAQMIQANLELGSSIGVSGTPGFVIGEELLPGAYPLDVIKEKIANARKNS